MSFEIHTLSTPGLGSSVFVLTHDGTAAIIDPQRDLKGVAQLVDELGVDPVLVLETHVHNDFLSGGRLAAKAFGGRLVLPARSGVTHPHDELNDGAALTLGSLTITALHTPGHTPEHLSYVVTAEGSPRAVFTGGSLLVGSVGRSDLLGDHHTPRLLQSQYASVHRIVTLPDPVSVHPTHGAGSFCSVSEPGTEASTIGRERRTNPFFQHADVEAFVAGAPDRRTAPVPAYFPYIAPINRRGPVPMPTEPLVDLDVDGLAALSGEGVVIVDTRPKAAVAVGRIPGSIAIETGPDFATWVGWLLPYEAPLALVVEPDEDVDHLRRALGRIGFDDIRGVATGLEAWSTEGHPLTGHETMTAREFVDLAPTDPQILDVRTPGEWDPSLDDVVQCHLPDLFAEVPATLDPTRPVYVGCTTGHRASTAAGHLADAGFHPVVLTGASLMGVAHLRRQATAG